MAVLLQTAAGFPQGFPCLLLHSFNCPIFINLPRPAAEEHDAATTTHHTKNSIFGLRPLNFFPLAKMSCVLFFNSGFLFVVGSSNNCCIHSVSHPRTEPCSCFRVGMGLSVGRTVCSRQIYGCSIFFPFYYDRPYFI